MKKTLSLILAGLIAGSMALSAAAANVYEADQGKVAFGVKKATATWNPDGIYDEGEYYDIDVKDTWISTMCGGDEAQNAKTAALDVDVAMSYDDEYFYLYMSYIDPDGFKFTTVDNPAWWDGDIMQFG
ncbi:MAG: hypothetical protein IKY52_04380, partial [Clostridia bacterium]|nr:hypothetical protein [Clostridia bacterium]